MDELKHGLIAFFGSSDTHGSQTMIECPLHQLNKALPFVLTVCVNMSNNIDDGTIIVVVGQPVQSCVQSSLMYILCVRPVLITVFY